MAYIGFDDGAASSVRSIYTPGGALATRFGNFTPSVVDIADRAAAMSTGRVAAAFVYRTEYRVSFELRNISPNGPSAVNRVTVANRFIRWAANGGLFLVYPEDTAGTDTGGREAFALTPPTLTLADARLMLYTLSVTAVSTTAVAWQAIYDGARE